jgi:NAD(P)-dependent dehydrogenase (short-subunit alcohol dehydrogenase family)
MALALVFDLQILLFLILLCLIFAFTLILATRNYLTRSCGRCLSQKSMAGRVVIVTGSNTGIGKETARDLARRGAKVILACRDLQKAESAASEIRRSSGNMNVVAKYCDLASLKSVRNFADDILTSELRLDVLICNAASGSPAGRHLTEDGFEIQFQVSCFIFHAFLRKKETENRSRYKDLWISFSQTQHLSHFLLVNLLLPLMERTPSGSRIVITSSLAHRFGRIDLENIARADHYSSHPFLTYCDTKLLNVILTKELSRRLQAANSNITVNTLHPGTIFTNGIRNCDLWYLKAFLMFMCYLYGDRTEEQGAQTLIHLSVSEEVDDVSGQYFADCRPANYNPLADDVSLAEKIWHMSCQLSGLDK